MKRQILLAIFSLLCLGLFSQNQVVLPKGYSVFVKTSDVVPSTSKVKQMSAYVTSDVVVMGQTVIKEGTPVLIDVKARKAGFIGRPGKVELKGISTTAIDGSVIDLTGSTLEKGDSHRGKSIGLTIGMFFVIPPFNFFFLLVKGDDCNLNARSFPLATKSECTITIP